MMNLKLFHFNLNGTENRQGGVKLYSRIELFTSYVTACMYNSTVHDSNVYTSTMLYLLFVELFGHATNSVYFLPCMCGYIETVGKDALS